MWHLFTKKITLIIGRNLWSEKEHILELYDMEVKGHMEEKEIVL